MEKRRIAVAQTAWPGARGPLIATYEALVHDAASDGAALVCLQEFTLSPYFASTIDPANFAWAEPLRGGETDRVLGGLARAHGVFIAGSLFERDEDGVCWDTATLHDPQGTLAGYTRKVHIPAGAGYHEDHYYGGAGDFPVHEAAGLRLALPTCYDQWFPELARIYALRGAEFIFYPTAIGSEPEHPNLDTQDAWRTVMRGHAIANGLYVAAANRIGQEGVTFYGGSFICDPLGEVLAQASRDQTEYVIAETDPARFAMWRRLFPLLRQRRPAVYGELVAGGDEQL